MFDLSDDELGMMLDGLGLETDVEELFLMVLQCWCDVLHFAYVLTSRSVQSIGTLYMFRSLTDQSLHRRQHQHLCHCRRRKPTRKLALPLLMAVGLLLLHRQTLQLNRSLRTFVMACVGSVYKL